MIRTTQGKAAEAYRALRNLQGRLMERRTAYKLFKLRKKLDEELEYIREAEGRLLQKYGYGVTPEGRILYGEDEEKHQEYIREWEEELNAEADIETEMIDLRDDDSMQISLEEMEALEPFLIIE